jgi:hypothetical protein
MLGLQIHLYSFDEYYYSYASTPPSETSVALDAIAKIYDVPIFWDKKLWYHEVVDGSVSTVYAFARREDKVAPDEIARCAAAIPVDLPLAYHSVHYKIADGSIGLTLSKRTQRANNEKRKKLLASVGETLLQHITCYDIIK